MQSEKPISADRLFKIAEVLGVSPATLVGFSEKRRHYTADTGGWPHAAADGDPTLSEQGLRLHRAFVSIENRDLREAIVSLVADLAMSENVG